MAVALASFKTSIEAISLGFNVAKGLRSEPSLKAVPNKPDGPTFDALFDSELIITPSITYNGLLEPFGESAPRILTDMPDPGCAEFCVILKPATFPCNKLSALTAFGASNSLALTEEIAPVTVFFNCEP